MGAPKNNEYWKLRSKHGRDKLFASPELLWEAACEYFEWVERHPLLEEKGFSYQGIVTKEDFTKIRAMTISQMCFYFHCSFSWWRQFKKDCEKKDENDFLSVLYDIETIIYNQKFQGAAAGLLETNIIARDLGLSEKTDHTSGGEKIQPINIIVDNSDTAKELEALRNGAKTD